MNAWALTKNWRAPILTNFPPNLSFIDYTDVAAIMLVIYHPAAKVKHLEKATPARRGFQAVVWTNFYHRWMAAVQRRHNKRCKFLKEIRGEMYNYRWFWELSGFNGLSLSPPLPDLSRWRFEYFTVKTRIKFAFVVFFTTTRTSQ